VLFNVYAHGSQKTPLCYTYMPTLSVDVGSTFESVCLSVCPEHKSKTNDPKAVNLGIGNDLEIQVTWFSGFRVTG